MPSKPSEIRLPSWTYPEPYYIYASLREQLHLLRPEIDLNEIDRAFDFAQYAHNGQYRDGGEPYIIHPIEVAALCVELNLDQPSIQAALLHDVVEDNQRIQKGHIATKFSPEVAELVDTLSKLKRKTVRMPWQNAPETEEQKILENNRQTRRLIISMVRDKRVMVIKLADRLWNLRTLKPLKKEKIVRIARETQDIYVPIANALGMWDIMSEMEDIIFSYLEPEHYEELKQEIDKRLIEQKSELNDTITKLILALDKEMPKKIKSIHGRYKHLTSINNKLKRLKAAKEAENSEFHPTLAEILPQLHDILGIRIILNGTPLDCYYALGIVHNTFKPKMNCFDDYISIPKKNGYQSLQTVIYGRYGGIEIQIRTIEMDRVAAKGIAAHWRYKSTLAKETFEDQEWLSIIQALGEMSDTDFIANTGTLLKDQVMVLGYKEGQVNTFSLPQDSTPVDFAFHVHTEVGYNCRFALVNKKPVPLDYKLRHGDLVEIKTGNEPNPALLAKWLVFVASPRSKLAIQNFMKQKCSAAQRVQYGKNILREYVVKTKEKPLNLLDNKKLDALLKRLKIVSLNRLYDDICTGKLNVYDLINTLKNVSYELDQKKDDGSFVITKRQWPDNSKINPREYIRHKGGGLLREKLIYGPCCNPILDDDIVGVLSNTTLNTLIIHRRSCIMLDKILTLPKMELQWRPLTEAERDELLFQAIITIKGRNRQGLLYNMLKIIDEHNLNIITINTLYEPSDVDKVDHTILDLILQVPNKDILINVIQNITNITPDVRDVVRPILIESNHPTY